jgi:hypothetical protein
VIAPALRYAQFAWGLRRTVRYPFPKDPEAELVDQLRHREARFLDHLRRVIATRPEHPVNLLLQAAHVELGDIESMVAQNGLEAALEKLRQAGVWVSHDEFKGRKPLVRGGRHIQASPSDFANPLVTDVWQRYPSSGSTGRRVVVEEGLAYFAHRQLWRPTALQQLGVGGRRRLQLSAIMPAGHGVTNHVWNQKLGLRVDHWYARVDGPMSKVYFRATQALLAELRLMGVPTPPVTRLPPNDFSPVARDIDSARASGQLSLLNGPASACVRVASAALEGGLDISGARFLCNGETLSASKAEVFHRAGTEAFATYMATEAGTVGVSCPHYEGQNTVHHFSEATAIVAHRRPAPWAAPYADEDRAGAEINSLLFTTLLPSAPFLLVNLELGDHGILGPAKCGCRFQQMGYDTVISGIYSYTKLTLYGGRLFGGDMARIIEEALPARFGGGPSDYQLVERDAGIGPRLVLRVNPRIFADRPVPAEAIRDCFFEEVRKLLGGLLWAGVLSHAGAVEVLAQPPLAGQTGKVLPFHLLGQSETLGQTLTLRQNDAKEPAHAP